MPGVLEVRESLLNDRGDIVSLYPLAFPDEDLVPLVEELLRDTPIRLSLVALVEGQTAGHVIFSSCHVGNTKVALLGPLAVAPARQRLGIGSALVRDGLARLPAAGFNLVCVLGDPAYYGRLGFVPETHVQPPYALPAAWQRAWQSQSLGVGTRASGTLVVPPPWRHRALWSETPEDS